MRKGVKIESHDLSLKREGMPQRKQRWNSHVLTAQERMVRRQEMQRQQPLKTQCVPEHVDGKCFLLGKEMAWATLMRACLVELINRHHSGQSGRMEKRR